MSILLAAASTAPSLPATIPAESAAASLALLAVLIVLSLLSLFLFWRFFIHDRQPATTWPVRFGSGDSMLKLFGLALICFFLMSWIAAISIPLLSRLPQEQARSLAGAIASMATFLTMVGVNAYYRPDGTRLIGLGPPFPGRAILAGLIGLVVIFPWLSWLQIIAKYIVTHLRTPIQTEHPIFQEWSQPQTTPSIRILLMITAVLIAPFFEELLFRGFLQTVLSRLFTPGSVGHERLLARWPTAPTGAPAPVPPILPPTPLARFAAIVVTSFLFAIIHTPFFIQPAIFLLSLGLGYVYERTGRLWASIAMHLFFNLFQFTLFLLIP